MARVWATNSSPTFARWNTLVHIVPCFEDPDLAHITGNIGTRRDIEIVVAELVLADLEALRRRREKIGKELKGGDKHALAESHVLDRIEPHLNAGKPAATLHLARRKSRLWRGTVPVDRPPDDFCRQREGADRRAEANPHVTRVREYAAPITPATPCSYAHNWRATLPICQPRKRGNIWRNWVSRSPAWPR